MDGCAAEISHHARITGVIKQGQSGIDGSANEDGFLPAGGAELMELCHLVGVELDELQTAQHQGAND